MPSLEDIDQQQQLLNIHRRTLANYLQQQAQTGSAFTPPSVTNGIREARVNIIRIKGILRGWNVDIEDHPDDDSSAKDNDIIERPQPKIPSKYLSDALYEPVRQASSAGGLGITFLILGALLMLVAFFSSERGLVNYIILLAGFVLILIVCIFFYLNDIKPLLNIQRNIKQSKELIDTIQGTALEMTALASDFQLLSFKYAQQTSNTLQVIRPQIRALPVIGKLADSKIITDTESLSSSIVDYTSRFKQVIEDTEQALITSNPESLRKYLTELRGLRINIEAFLKKR